ncbi:hypothetical protein BCR42DRAFT_395643 [Absidia repens]|uniref:Uncharacterized protein n=1 Tax=Absidia repens TaxID=90262 RepID=A0A1X2I6H1_9FUNG|nr:hypothetical protein BCR42DRAFT_395643 [Absidia repens]
MISDFSRLKLRVTASDVNSVVAEVAEKWNSNYMVAHIFCSVPLTTSIFNIKPKYNTQSTCTDLIFQWSHLVDLDCVTYTASKRLRESAIMWSVCLIIIVFCWLPSFC